jgi:hypothetical protein
LAARRTSKQFAPTSPPLFVYLDPVHAAIMHRLRRDGRWAWWIDEGVLVQIFRTRLPRHQEERWKSSTCTPIVSRRGRVCQRSLQRTGQKPTCCSSTTGADAPDLVYEVSAVGFSLTKTQKPVAQNDLPDCLAMWKAYDAWRRLPADQRDPSRRRMNAAGWCR